MPKGYMIVRYTGPSGAPGVFEAWNEAAWKWFGEVAWPMHKTAGATGWRVTNDWFGNTPRTMMTIEYESVERAAAALSSPEFNRMSGEIAALGTVDFQVTVHSLSAEGK